MEKGSFRRLARPLLGALALACLAPVAVRPSGPLQRVPPDPIAPPPGFGDGTLGGRPSPGSGWWDVGVVVSVKGEYAVRGGAVPVAGTYAFRARWTGRLELDSAGDFVLVHLGTEVLEWRLRETGRFAGRESVLEAASATKPALRMEYLIKDGREVEFVFGLGSIGVPLHEPGLDLALELPRTSSRQPGRPGRAYGDFVCRGSCRVAVPETDFAAQAPERRFSWDWRREKALVRQGREVTFVESHGAEAVVTVIIH
jgi:hypothetical protein